MNLGVFGGTFNPIHIGHINASLKFYDEAKLDILLIIPDRIPPHKETKVISAEHRMNMLQLVYENPEITMSRNIVVSDMELLRNEKSYTITTLKNLSEQYPAAQLFLYVGSDMFYTLESWFCGDEILKMCTIVTAARQNFELEKIKRYLLKYKNSYGTDSIIMNYEPIDVSSTEIRSLFSTQNHKNNAVFTKKLLTDEVAKYIIENGLYNG